MNVKNGVPFHISLIMLDGIEANKWINKSSSGYSYVTKINLILVQCILDYYDNIVFCRNFFDPKILLHYFSFFRALCYVLVY